VGVPYGETTINRKWERGMRLEDCEEIRRLYARYCWTTDNGDWEGRAACFTHDGSFVAPGLEKSAGREALVESSRAYKEFLGPILTQHVCTNVRFELDGDRGEGGCYFQYYQTQDGVSSLAAVGFYHDKFRKEDGKWLFESRSIGINGMA
jgi:3-phenylpropionate/cinnamic acid dioxygenase small subunit